MKIFKIFRFRLKVTKVQDQILRKYAGCARFVYNKALSVQKERYQNGLKKQSYLEMSAELTSWKTKDDTIFLKEAVAQTLQQKLIDLDKAFINFFHKRCGFPKFKKRGTFESFRFSDVKPILLQEGNKRIKLPKIGFLKYYKSRNIKGDIRNVTISNDGKNWFISIQTQQDIKNPIHTSQEKIGIDLGIKHFATTSDGKHISSLNSFKKNRIRLKKEQRKLSRKEKGSENRKKQLLKVRKIHRRITNCRHDYLHKLTTELSKNHAIIVVEDLKVKNMSHSAKGTKESPGKNIKSKSGLNRSILDQAWFEFRRQLTYKQAWIGGKLISVPSQYTSQKCSYCNSTKAENRKKQSLFICQSCGFEENADINAAKNILAAGLAVLACGEKIRPLVLRKAKLKAFSMKQEPILLKDLISN